MGVTCVDVTVRNPTRQVRAWTGAFLVDTRTTDSLAPRRTLGAIGRKPDGRRLYVLRDPAGCQYSGCRARDVGLSCTERTAW